jgi:hypothetical protein
MRATSITYEQAVYGSFPFWDRGYAVLGRSPGCREEWLADFRAICSSSGERPAGFRESKSLFALKMASGPWAIVGVFPIGRDDTGRPGASAFHGLFVKGADYRRAGASPFAFRELLRDDWGPDDTTLDAGRLAIPESSLEPVAPDPAALAAARAIERGMRVLVRSDEPIDDTARRVWAVLSPKMRARAGIATWVFHPANDFRLAGMPRIQKYYENWYVDLNDLLEEPVNASTEIDHLRRSRRVFWAMAALAAAIVIVSSCRGAGP